MADTGLTFVQKKFVPKTFWKCENKAEVQRCFTSKFHRDAPTCVTISEILDNFENHGTIQCRRKGYSDVLICSECSFLLHWMVP